MPVHPGRTRRQSAAAQLVLGSRAAPVLGLDLAVCRGTTGSQCAEGRAVEQFELVCSGRALGMQRTVHTHDAVISGAAIVAELEDESDQSAALAPADGEHRRRK